MSADPHERAYDTLIAEGDDGPMIEAVLDWLAQLVPRLAELRAQMEEEPLTAAEEAAIDVALRGVFASLRPMRKGPQAGTEIGTSGHCPARSTR